MNMTKWGTSLGLVMTITLTSGCMQQRHRETEARISGAEDMAAAARVHANDAYTKAEQALKVALEAQHSADDANRRASLRLDKK
ncbi:Lpp/OprI family alanine-zipper lipoprotein [Pseudomonas abietaniphila]|uniref:Outer membrane lipoprotein OprI n=1 Tax=Pseudomonas abietaniphila TaxID=89065 RepID=A0A1G8GEF9_9PSED|nr:Lpp/OprI family alanine-zipper lipoprotein [Pseudomonas abietaniphila]SDH92759.1 Protein of unknown function [Pseudomonas abietaniphila]